MEPIITPKKNRKVLIGVIVMLVIIVTGCALWYKHTLDTAFCFNFVHDTQFGDRKMDNAVNQGIGAPGGMVYYLPEVPALQTALTKQGFYIDPYEATGGKVYLAAFFGPTTQVAVKEFQKKYAMPETGEVTNNVIDKLRSLYGCPTETVTPKQATTTNVQ